MFDVNEYFDGNVKSIAFDTNTLPATVGVMKTGEYEFSTGKKETMQVISGQLSALLPDATEWATFEAGQTFEVPANSSFKVKASPDTAYLCLYE